MIPNLVSFSLDLRAVLRPARSPLRGCRRLTSCAVALAFIIIVVVVVVSVRSFALTLVGARTWLTGGGNT